MLKKYRSPPECLEDSRESSNDAPQAFGHGGPGGPHSGRERSGSVVSVYEGFGDDGSSNVDGIAEASRHLDSSPGYASYALPNNLQSKLDSVSGSVPQLELAAATPEVHESELQGGRARSNSVYAGFEPEVVPAACQAAPPPLLWPQLQSSAMPEYTVPNRDHSNNTTDNVLRLAELPQYGSMQHPPPTGEVDDSNYDLGMPQTDKPVNGGRARSNSVYAGFEPEVGSAA